MSVRFSASCLVRTLRFVLKLSLRSGYTTLVSGKKKIVEYFWYQNWTFVINKYKYIIILSVDLFISPLPACRGTLSLLAVCPSVSQSVTLQFSRLFSAVFWDIELKFDIWICHDIIQIKFDFRHAWLTFTGVIALCLNSVFKIFFCSLEILTWNLVYEFVMR